MMGALPATVVMDGAKRAKFHEARRHFNAGGSVLVSEYGHETTRPVGPMTTVHDRQSIKWADLVDDTRMWSNRYPNSRYYVVPFDVIPAVDA